MAHKAFVYLVSCQRFSWEFATSHTHGYLQSIVAVLLKCDYEGEKKKTAARDFVNCCVMKRKTDHEAVKCFYCVNCRDQ